MSNENSEQKPKLTDAEKSIISEAFNSHSFDDDNNDVMEGPSFVGIPERIDNLLEFVSSHKARPVSNGMKFEVLEGSLIYVRVVGTVSLGEDYFDETEDLVPVSAVYICENTFEAMEKSVKSFEEAFRCPVKAVLAVLVPKEDVEHIKELGAVPPVPCGALQHCVDVANMALRCLESRIKCFKGDYEEIADRYGIDIFFAAPSDTDEETATISNEPTLFAIASNGSGIRLYVDDMDPGLFQSMYLLDRNIEEEV